MFFSCRKRKTQKITQEVIAIFPSNRYNENCDIPAAQGCRISGAYVLDQRAGGHFGAQDAAFFQITVLERGNDDLFHHIEAADEV